MIIINLLKLVVYICMTLSFFSEFAYELNYHFKSASNI